MADDLKPSESLDQAAVEAEVLPPAAQKPAHDGGSLSSKGERMLWLLVAALIVASAWLGWRAFYHQEEGDPVASAMLAFEKQNSLVVFSSRFEVVAESIDTRGILNVELLESRQAAIIPASVEYRLDLSEMGADKFRWDPDSETLDVTLPQLQISRPNLDEAQARVFTEGVWVTREAARDLAANNSVQAERKAEAFAKNPEVLSLARAAAKHAIEQNLAVPLQVAGYDSARISVRFADE